MATDVDKIRRWLNEAKAKNATHVFVITDTFDYSDYPVPFTGTSTEAQDAASKYPRDMKKLTEVYKLDMDWDEQLEQHRAFNY